ncbi:MAG: head-tail connector protein [Oscillospiraceae bacterium]
MAVTEKGLKEYMRLPTDSTEDVSTYIDAAKAKAAAAGIPTFNNNAQYDLFLYALATMYYDNRGMAFSGAYQATAESTSAKLINSFVLELRHAKDGDGS